MIFFIFWNNNLIKENTKLNLILMAYFNFILFLKLKNKFYLNFKSIF